MSEVTDINEFRGKRQNQRIASRMLESACEAQRKEAARLDREPMINPWEWLDTALEGKTPAEQIVIIAGVGGMFGWTNIELEKSE